MNLEKLKEKIADTPTIKVFLNALLDKIDRTGKPPQTFSISARSLPEPDAVRQFFSHALTRIDGKNQLRINLKDYLEKFPGVLDDFYLAMQRRPKNLEARKAREIETSLAIIDLFIADTKNWEGFAPFQRWLLDERENARQGKGEILRITRSIGPDELHKLLGQLQRGFTALCESDQPLRLSRFGLAVTGDSKSCRVGTPLYRRFAEILGSYDSSIKDMIEFLSPDSTAEKHRAILEQTRLIIDGAATQLLVFGGLVFRNNGFEFPYVSDHAKSGEPVLLGWQQLNSVEIMVAPPQVMTIENETSFYDFIERADPNEYLVICSMGQANRLLIKLLQQLQNFGRQFSHWGDLDRSGVLILESMRRRTGIDIKPFKMDVGTYKENIEKGLPLSAAERDRIAGLLKREPTMICRDLLDEILQHQLWIEQENIMIQVE
ncbi:MAG: Wadjet anti-phage system protein JetD domain-containing protein [Candidatus Rifleibacteriota bacterium]